MNFKNVEMFLNDQSLFIDVFQKIYIKMADMNSYQNIYRGRISVAQWI
jgi:hypothetical protein